MANYIGAKTAGVIANVDGGTIENATLGSSVTFPTKKLINHEVFIYRDEITSIGEGFISTFDTTITAKSSNSCFKYTMTSAYGINANDHSASDRLYVEVNSGSTNLIKDNNNNDGISSVGSFPDTGKLVFQPSQNHGMPISFSHFDYTSHSAGDSLKYKFFVRTQSNSNVVFNRASNGTDTDYRATSITTIIIEEFEK